MLWDCFTYFNEEEILRIRLEELGEVVDRFVIIESEQTFTGQPKPIYSEQVGDWIEPWEDKILRYVVDFPNIPMDAWEREKRQRNQIFDIVEYNAEDDDIIIISDVDEIPRANVINRVGPVQLDVVQYFWGPHWQVPAHCNQGGRPVVLRKKDFIVDAQEFRSRKDLPRVPSAGWHFSFFKAEESIDAKLSAFSHTEFDQPEYKDTKLIEQRIKQGVDPFDRFPLKWTEIDETFPKYIQENYK